MFRPGGLSAARKMSTTTRATAGLELDSDAEGDSPQSCIDGALGLRCKSEVVPVIGAVTVG